MNYYLLNSRCYVFCCLHISWYIAKVIAHEFRSWNVKNWRKKLVNKTRDFAFQQKLVCFWNAFYFLQESFTGWQNAILYFINYLLLYRRSVVNNIFWIFWTKLSRFNIRRKVLFFRINLWYFNELLIFLHH